MSATDRERTLGRDGLDDIEAILGVANTDVDEVTHTVVDNADAIFTWDYSLARPALRRLYEKAKTAQWNATAERPWDTEVDVAHTVATDQVAIFTGLDPHRCDGTLVETWGADEWLAFGVQSRKCTLSQFLHGEQGALLCTAKIVE